MFHTYSSIQKVKKKIPLLRVGKILHWKENFLNSHGKRAVGNYFPHMT